MGFIIICEKSVRVEYVQVIRLKIVTLRRNPIENRAISGGFIGQKSCTRILLVFFYDHFSLHHVS